MTVLVLAQGVLADAQTSAVDLARASLEDLMKIEITSASRKEQRASDTPAAVYVITQEDIRRTGMTSLPDLLRLVPGADVAEINSSNWAVSARGFNGLFANKLLVMIDGRTIYSPLFASVLWDTKDLVLEDIDRIEVIRGPGGAVWGANAVNGVVNVITKRASDTHGPAASIRASSSNQQEAAAHYGGVVGTGSYRAYSKWTSTLDFPERSADARSSRVTSGVRADWETLTLQSDFTTGTRNARWLDFGALPNVTTLDQASRSHNVSALARWTHSLRPGATVQVQSFLDVDNRVEPVGSYDRRTADVDVEYHGRAGDRHDIVAGGGYRSIQESFEGAHGYTFNPDGQHEHLVNAFAQDEIGLDAARRLRLTLGAKVEHGVVAGTNVQPTVRAIWDAIPGSQHVWAAASRAVRTASLLDRGFILTFPYQIPGVALPAFNTVTGNPNAGNEILTDWEAGYRLDIRSTASIDVTGFAGHYDGLRTSEPQASTVRLSPFPHIENVVQFGNLLDVDTHGVEVSARWQIQPAWRVDGAYSTLHLAPHPAAASRDPNAATFDGNAPSEQWRLHTAVTIRPRVEIDGTVWRVGQIRESEIAAYTRVDARLSWPLSRKVSVAVSGRNLTSAAHYEFNGRADQTLATPVTRSIVTDLHWGF